MIQPTIPADAGAGILAQDERMELDWFNLQDEPYQAMQAATPQLSALKRNIHGLRTLLTVLFEQSLGTRARKEAASVQIFAAMPKERMSCYNIIQKLMLGQMTQCCTMT